MPRFAKMLAGRDTLLAASIEQIHAVTVEHHQIVLALGTYHANAMADTFIKNGVKLVSGGTDNHLLLLNLSDTEMTGLELETLLEKANITVNKNTVPNEKRKPTITSGVRIGAPSITTRGMKEKESVMIAEMITRIIKEGRSAVKEVKAQVKELIKKFPLPY